MLSILAFPKSSPSEMFVLMPNPYRGFHSGHLKNRRTRIRNPGFAATSFLAEPGLGLGPSDSGGGWGVSREP